jgi:hypothetical protein
MKRERKKKRVWVDDETPASFSDSPRQAQAHDNTE